MLNTTHQASGAAAGAWLGVATGAGPALVLAGTGLGWLVAALPDLDHLDAKPVRKLTVGRIRYRRPSLFRRRRHKYRVVRIGIGPLISWVLRYVSQVLTGRKHRGITHSLLFAYLVSVMVFFPAAAVFPATTALYLGASAWWGVCAALAGDAITKSSLKHLFWPLDIELNVPMWVRIETGHFGEGVIMIFVVASLVSGLWLALSGGFGG
jgi:hypothetical protein